MLYIGMSQGMQVCSAVLPAGVSCGISLKNFSSTAGFSAGVVVNIFFDSTVIVFFAISNQKS